jgi:hypothetical protein
MVSRLLICQGPVRDGMRMVRGGNRRSTEQLLIRQSGYGGMESIGILEAMEVWKLNFTYGGEEVNGMR